ncbi:MAG: NmrA family NAD(P)-binding protein [Armatimonadetes bacterium]|nr:NmrA family NAD(P)-binding protein [Armatimonadota bacterium]
MILVTGAAGKTGRAVIRALAARGAVVRALVSRPEHVDVVRSVGAQDVIVGDLRAQTAVAQALRGVRAVYHICPNVHPDEVTIGTAMIAASHAEGIAHFVYHSVLLPQVEAMPHHWQKLRVEERLVGSGLPYTILQPASYMQNVLAGWQQIVTAGVYRVPYALETRLGMVDLADVAEAAAVVLTTRGHQAAIYELAGPEVLNQVEIAAALGRVLGRPVRAEVMPLEMWERQARASGLGDYQVRTLLAMFRYYERRGFWGTPNILRWLLGRSPTTFAACVERTVRDGARP